MLHRGSVRNTSRTELSTSPAAEVCDKILGFEFEGNKVVDCCARIARLRRDDRRQEQIVQNPRLVQSAVFRRKAEYWAQHASDGMVDVFSRKCRAEGCGKRSSCGVAGMKIAGYCAQHAQDGMVDVKSRKCRTEGCRKHSSYGVAGTKITEYCAQHAPDGMVDVKRRKCRTEGCGKQPLFGVAGTKTTEYCAQHAPDGMVNVCSRKCKTEGCSKQPSFGVAGTKTAEYCAQHAPNAMVNVYSKKCRTAKAAASNRRMALQARKLRGTVLSTHGTGWSSSTAGSAEPKAAARNRGME